MKRLFALNAATHVEDGKKNLIARKSPQQVFLVNATSKAWFRRRTFHVPNLTE